MADAENWTNFMENYKDRILDTFEKNGIASVHDFITRSLEEWRNVPQNIAVTGNSGAGKSSFINTIRGKLADDEDGADVDVVTCTEEPTPYPYHENENLVLWDLPGVGTKGFGKKQYLEKVNFRRYDCFIIVSASRFTLNDLWLANAVKENNEFARSNERKLFYFVRTKIDLDLQNEKKSHNNPHSDDVILQRIRTSTKQMLTNEGFPEEPIFLIANYEKHKYDFGHLIQRLIRESPAEKAEAMALSLNVQTDEIIDEKYETLRKRMWKVCLASATGGSVPIPGFSILVDETVLAKEVKAYRNQFGLNEEDIRRVAGLLEIPFEELQDTLELESTGFVITIRGLMTVFAGAAFSEYIENAAKFAIPVVGGIIAGGVSFYSTRYILTKALDSMLKDAKKLNKRICEMLNENRNSS